MKPGGFLIVESQGIPGREPTALFPAQRYAKVPGTYFVPTGSCLANWLSKLHRLREDGLSWEDTRAWIQRRWEAGNEAERAWPDVGKASSGPQAPDCTKSS